FSASVQSDQYCVTFFVGLSSVPLCPGVTVSPTTMEMSTTAMGITSQQSSQYTSEITSTIAITSSPLRTTTTTTTTVISNNKSQWPLILALCLLALILALCCLFLFCYYCLCSRDRRRRRKKARVSEHIFGWNQENIKSTSKLQEGRYQSENSELGQIKNVAMISNSRASSCVGNIQMNTSETTIDDQLLRNSANSSRQFKSPAGTTLDVISRENLMRIPSPLKDISDFSTVSFSRSARSKVNSVNTTKVPHDKISSAKSQQPIITVKVREKDYSNTRTRNRRVSSVSVSRIQRSVSADQKNHINQRITTTSSNNKVNRITVVKIK
ncbi:unnamed protein product, partial [Adineta steineri]